MAAQRAAGRNLAALDRGLGTALVLGAALVLGSCASRTDQPTRSAQPTAPAATQPQAGVLSGAALRERMRELAKPSCGTCHQSTRPTSRAAALAIFDLDAPGEWSAPLTVARLEGGFKRRLQGQFQGEDRDIFLKFIDQEVATRRHR
jgi:hypothetical protein